jgi:single-stranded-DNA-specific exonuclease
MEPLIVIPDGRVAYADVVGKDHVRFQIMGADGSRVSGIAFRIADQPLGKGLLASRGKRVHVAGRLRSDEWNGQTRVQLHLEDAAPADV